LSAAVEAAARPFVGRGDVVCLAWDRELVVRGAAGWCALIRSRAGGTLDGQPLTSVFHPSPSLTEALERGTTATLELREGAALQLEAGPCPGGAVGILRIPSRHEAEPSPVDTLAHDLRNAFSTVSLAIQSLARQDEVRSERGRTRLSLAVRELQRIDRLLCYRRVLVWASPPPPSPASVGSLSGVPGAEAPDSDSNQTGHLMRSPR
jgi:hypothetical protein